MLIKEIVANKKRRRKKNMLAKECMDLWAKIVKLRANNFCEYCKKTNRLNAHHIYSRSNIRVRYDINNGICLCSGCHSLNSNFSAHKTPMEFTKWILKKRGEQWYKKLSLKANYYGGQKLDLKLEKLYLLQELKKYDTQTN